MPSKNKDFGFGLLTFVFFVSGLLYLAQSIIAIKNGTTISFGRGTQIQISPWVGVVISATLLILATLGIIKLWKDRDKYPPL
jgi:hypothetical protein